MLQRLIIWVKEFWRSIVIGKSSIKDKLGVDVFISQEMASALELWSNMYVNKAPWLNDEVVSTNLAAAISSEIARLSTLEMRVKVDGSPRAAYLLEQLETVLLNMRSIIELGAAKGSVILKPYISDGHINVDIVQADQFLPVAFDANGGITDVVFVDQRAIGDTHFTRLEQHTLKQKEYTVRNKAYKSTTRDALGQEIALTEVPDWAELKDEATIANVERPLYGYFRYPLANSIDPTSPLGVSCFSRAVKQIEQADRQWSDLLWEFDSGKRALFIDVLAFGKDKDGKAILPNRRLYRTVETGSAEGEFFQEWSPDFREQNIIAGFDAILKQIEFLCGLAYGTISDPNIVDRTATEIKSTKQRSYSTVVDTQKAITRMLDGLLYAMDVWATLGKLAPRGKYTATYDYDDSIIVDRSAQFTEDLRLVTTQIMSKIEFRMRNMREDEATAKKMLAMVASEEEAQTQIQGEQGTAPGEEF